MAIRILGVPAPSMAAVTGLVSAFVLVAGSASGAPSGRARGADLAVQRLANPPASINRGAAFRSAFTVANLGTRRARKSTVRQYLSRDSRKSKGDVLLAPAKSVPALEAGKATRRTGMARIPRATPTGLWFLIACADPRRIVRETNDRNNCRRSARRTAVLKPPPPGAPTLQQVDGGPGYYGGFSNALPSDPSYFPIGVWFESVVSQADVARDKDAGLNNYVVLTGNSNLALLRTNGMKALLQHGEWRSSSAVGSQTAAWELADEIDMERSPDAGYAELQRIKSTLPADGRLRYNNFGKGVMFWETNQEAARYVNAVDLPSDDIYWFTDPGNVCAATEGGALFFGRSRALTQAECRRASNYGAVVQKMRNLVSPARSKPVWNFVELGHPFTESFAPSITPPQVRAAVWHSLIAGARGIIYFNHSFAGPCQTQHALRDPCYANVRATVKAVNRQIKALAPVLNAPTVTSGWTKRSGTKAMVKWQGGHFYLFAGSAENVSSTGSFSIPCVGDAKATVVGENRTIPVNAGSFSDSFGDGNGVHIYRIDGGSACGLT